LLYFTQEAGEPLNIVYVKSPYGPYATNLGFLGSDMQELDLPLLVLKDMQGKLETQERVSKLIEGFESSFGLELLSAVHWSMLHEGVRDQDVVDAMQSWKLRNTFTEKQIRIAVKRFMDHGWIVT